MKTRVLSPIGLLAIACAAAACAQPPSGLKTNKTYNEDPTQEPSQAPGAYNGGDKNTFDHFNDLSEFGGRDPFDILAQREEEGPAEVRTRLHSCQKITYATLGNILSSLGVDLAKKSTPPSAGQLYAGGKGALGVANYDARVSETITWSAAGAAKLFDIFVQAAPEIIANLPNMEQCQIDSVGPQMFDADNACNPDALACIMGRPASTAQVSVCSHLVQTHADIETGKKIAVATILAATHSCE